MRRKYLTLIVLLEAYAMLLALFQFSAGLRTDEAKYLLNIPYPHPPLLRWIMDVTSSVPGHELLWRFLLASLLVQCVWFFVDLGAVLTRPRRHAVLLGWLFSSAVLLQGGTVMLVIPTAACAVFFLWYALHAVERSHPEHAALLGLLWLAALFAAYQAILFAPLVWVSLRRTGRSKKMSLAYFLTPIALLILYTFGNPFAIASMNIVSTKDAGLPFLDRFLDAGTLLLIGGSAALTLTGIIGIVTSRRSDLVLTFALVLGYVALSHHPYYALLFTPLLVDGTFLVLCKRKLRPSLLTLSHVVTAMIVALIFWPRGDAPHRARETMDALRAQGIRGSIIIDGPFGHEWQYEARDLPIRRFTQTLSTEAEEEAVAFVCTKVACDDDVDTIQWIRVGGTPVPAWIKRS